MTATQPPDAIEHDSPLSDNARLAALVIQCQTCYREWHSSEDFELAMTFREQYGIHIKQLWEELQHNLCKAVFKWMHDDMAHDTETLAMSLFTGMVDVLPELHIDPTRNVRSFLLTIAARCYIDSKRKFSDGPRPRNKSSTSEDEPPNSKAAQMWSPHGTSVSSANMPYLREEVIDQESQDIEERIIAQVDNSQIIRAIKEYWPRTLSQEDYLIMSRRYLEEPPCSFREIASELGKGWTEEAVRQRHFRAIKTTRKYLHERGLL